MAAIVAASLAVEARTLYKLVSRDGKVTYVDKVPPGFAGEVIAIEIDAPPDAPGPAPPRATATPSQAGAPEDRNSQRRANRERLQAALDAAREKVAAARKALADGATPVEGEYQVIQQWFEVQGRSPGPRGNCNKRTASNGRTMWLCPTQVPGEAFRDRQKEREDALASAEVELEIAERNYRRGVD